MALTEVKVRNAKPTEKPVKLTDGMVCISWFTLRVQNTGGFNIAFLVSKKCWRLVFIPKCL